VGEERLAVSGLLHAEGGRPQTGDPAAGPPVQHLDLLRGQSREISWVHASELADPTEYLDGAELLLSVGIWLDPAVGAAALNKQAAAYVRRLVEVGVVGSGSACSTPRCRPRRSPRPTR
jgi:hypothetical protein